MADFGYAEALRRLSRDASAGVGELLRVACAGDGDPVVYLADYGRRVLLPLDDQVKPEPVAGTPAGTAFATGRPQALPADGAARIWVPVPEQTSRIGVLAVTMSDDSPGSIAQAEHLGVFAGLAVAGSMRVSDHPRSRREAGRLSLPASMQWDMLPPWAVRVPGASAAGILEPAYDIAGDAFDYVINDGQLHFAIFDGMGHGIGATLLTSFAVGTYRHTRRTGASLPVIHAAIDRALAARYDDMSFVTGILGTLNVTTGRVEYTCAGHPPPLLLRRPVAIDELPCTPTVPFGLGLDGAPGPVVNSAVMAPGDALLLYTDGVTEAHDAGHDLFGLSRLIELLDREAALDQEPEELLDTLTDAVIGHQEGDLRDDATLLLIRLSHR
jgi:serine phosphatase RsbU (regulator of sigma subunit)